MINIDDFKKVELKVAKVLSAENIEGSEKLLKLQVDLGPSVGSGQVSEQRQILSGIAKYYKPEELVGRNIVIISNLESRQMMGLESQGMVLAANSESGPVLIVPDKEVNPGTLLR